MISGNRSRRAQRARMEELRGELEELRGALSDAYGLFNRTADPALLEASILEISALHVRYDRLLRGIKDLNGEDFHDHRHHRAAGHCGRHDLPAAEIAEKTDQMGV